MGILSNFWESLVTPNRIDRTNPFFDEDDFVLNGDEFYLDSGEGRNSYNFNGVARHKKYLQDIHVSPSKKVFDNWLKSNKFPDYANGVFQYGARVPFTEVQNEARTLFCYATLAAIDILEVAKQNPGKEIYMPSVAGLDVLTIWMMTDQNTFSALCKRLSIDLPLKIRNIKNISDPDLEDSAAIARTWFSACQLDSVFCAGPKFLPNIFVTDQRIVEQFSQSQITPRNLSGLNFRYDHATKNLRVTSDIHNDSIVQGASPKSLIENCLLDKMDYEKVQTAERACDLLKKTFLCDDSGPIKRKNSEAGGRINLLQSPFRE